MHRPNWLARLTLPLAIGGLLACSDPPVVIQGKVVAVDEAAKTISVEDEKAAATTLVLGVGNAEVGAATEVGNVVRVAYRVRDGKAEAVRVMNITKQAELRESKGGH